MSKHSTAGPVSRDLCDALVRELALHEPGIERNEAKEVCGCRKPPHTRFAYIYHRAKPKIEIYFRAPENLLSGTVPPSINLIDRSRPSGWGQFPASFEVSDKNAIPEIASFLMSVAYPLSISKHKPAVQTENEAEAGKEEVRGGGGFGLAADNLLVEYAAISLVRLHYESNNWTVLSVERDKCGFDLRCSKNSLIENVEVKGINGSLQSFIITAGELKQAQTNPNFVLIVVTLAMSQAPIMTRYTGKEFCKSFGLSAIQYQAVLNRRAGVK